MTWLRKLTIGLPIVVALLFAATWGAGSIARSRLSQQYPAPGQLVDIGGYRLHIHCVGKGPPTVVIEAGLNEFSVQWAQVQSEAAKFVRVCVYDRAGLGWSDRGALPRSGTVMVTELHALLENAGIQGPLLLVGHSFGGLLVREYTHYHPDEVIGLVLVDAAHEDYLQRIPQIRPLIAQGVKQFQTLAWLQRFGLLAWRPEGIPARGLTGAALERYRAVLAMTDYFATAALESAALEHNLSEARALPLATLGDLPLVVLSRGSADPLPGLSQAENEHYEREWQVLQSRLPLLSHRSRVVIAKRSGHDIQLTQPQLVVDAIHDMTVVAQ